MPPWSSRLHPGPSTSSSNAAHSHVSAIPDAERTVPIPINDDVPILIPFDTPRPAASARRTHSRSISHPFPSLFGGSNKKNHKGVTKQDFLDSDDDDDFVTYKPDLRSNSPRKSSQRQGPAEDFLTGRCMTCDSTVRWPRDVKVFRCTVCLMVNDLEPYRDSGDAPHHGHPGRTETPAAKGLYRKGTISWTGYAKITLMLYLKLLPYRLNGRRESLTNASRLISKGVWISLNLGCHLPVSMVSTLILTLPLKLMAPMQRNQLITENRNPCARGFRK
jgi:E3 ubiquitin-protein ligase HECTD2